VDFEASREGLFCLCLLSARHMHRCLKQTSQMLVAGSGRLVYVLEGWEVQFRAWSGRFTLPALHIVASECPIIDQSFWCALNGFVLNGLLERLHVYRC